MSSQLQGEQIKFSDLKSFKVHEMILKYIFLITVYHNYEVDILFILKSSMLLLSQVQASGG